MVGALARGVKRAGAAAALRGPFRVLRPERPGSVPGSVPRSVPRSGSSVLTPCLGSALRRAPLSVVGVRAGVASSPSRTNRATR